MTMPMSARRVTRRSHANVEARLLATIETITSSGRRLDRSPALGPRAERTRRALLDSASALFRSQGYARTTVAEVAANAGVSLASFYQYFPELEDVLAVLVAEFLRRLLDDMPPDWDVDAGRAGLHDFVDASVGRYVGHSEFMELWECAKLVSPRIRALSCDYRDVLHHRLAVSFADGIRRGLVRDDLDAAVMAEMTTAMVDRYCYEHFVIARESAPRDRSTIVRQLTEMWASAVHLTEVS
jgi:AcrR family transcriptional regulator